MIQRILHSRLFLACLLTAATGMALYFRAPFPEDNIFLRVMAIRSAPAFLFFKYSYTLFLYTTPYLEGKNVDAGKQDRIRDVPLRRTD
jgi:cytochrome b subunit of formate dehydrogenase